MGLPIDQAWFCDVFLHVPRVSPLFPTENNDDEEEKLDCGMLDVQDGEECTAHLLDEVFPFMTKVGLKCNLDQCKGRYYLCHTWCVRGLHIPRAGHDT